MNIDLTALPKGWVWTTLSKFITLESGSRPKGGVRSILEGIPSLGGEHLNDEGGFNFEKIKYVPEAYFKSLNKGQIYPDDIIVVKDGATTGKTSFVDSNFPHQHAAVNEHLFIVRVDAKVTFPKYVFYFLFSSKGQKQVLSDFRGATVGGISRNFPLKVTVPIPPLAEQRRIVAKLAVLFTHLDAAVDNLKEAHLQLHRYRQSILKAAFEGALTREWNEEDRKDLREVVQLKEVANLRREKVQPKDSSEKLNFVGLKHIDSGVSILKRWGDASEVKSTKARFYPNDVLYGKLRPYLDKAVIAEMEGICSADILVITADSKMIPRFLVYLLHSHPFMSHGIATSSGITLPRTSWDALGEFTFALPSLTEQKQIISELERHLSVADEIEATLDAEIKRAERLRQSILKQAFSGQLVPQDPNDEPASVLLEKVRDEKERQQPRRRKTIPKSKTPLSGKQMSLPLN